MLITFRKFREEFWDTADPWTAQVWTVWIHLYAFLSVGNTTVLHDLPLVESTDAREPWMRFDYVARGLLTTQRAGDPKPPRCSRLNCRSIQVCFFFLCLPHLPPSFPLFPLCVCTFFKNWIILHRIFFEVKPTYIELIKPQQWNSAVSKWMDRQMVIYIYEMEYYSAMKKIGVLIYAMHG